MKKPQGQKRDMALKIAQATGVRFVDTLAIIERFMDEVTQTLVSGRDVELRGFGKFVVCTRKGRTYESDMVGAQVVVPDKRIVRFKMGNLLKAGVTGGKKVTLLGVKRCRKNAKTTS